MYEYFSLDLILFQEQRGPLIATEVSPSLRRLDLVCEEAAGERRAAVRGGDAVAECLDGVDILDLVEQGSMI